MIIALFCTTGPFVAPTAYQPNRPVDLYIDASKPAKFVALLDKGTNFERATFAAG